MTPQEFFADTAWLKDLGSVGTLLALLLCGHILGDFVFQIDKMVKNKDKFYWRLLHHVCAVTFLQTICLLPFASSAVFVGVVVLGVIHFSIDCLQGMLNKWISQMSSSFLRQVLHGCSLGALWWFLVEDGPPLLHPALEPEALTIFAVVLSAVAFNCNGGGAVVGMLLSSVQLSGSFTKDAEKKTVTEESEKVARMGRTIGILERQLLLILGLAGEWGALGLILAAKSLARFKDLEDRDFSEYYLIGTLTSVLIALLSGLVVQLLI